MNISEILAKFDTDKVNGHTYGGSYDEIFSKFDRQAPLEILEVGSQRGGSLLAWKEYFPNANVTGIDIIDVIRPDYRSAAINYLVKDVKEYKTEKQFDIIIDDGSHFLSDVEYTVANFKLKAGGVMVIEDVQDPGVWIWNVRRLMQPGCRLETIDLREPYDNFLITIWNS